jgi:hypothetical protein
MTISFGAASTTDEVASAGYEHASTARIGRPHALIDRTHWSTARIDRPLESEIAE